MRYSVDIFVQSFGPNGLLERTCLARYKKYLKPLGFNLVIYDLTNEIDYGYLGNVVEYCKRKPELQHVLFGFDDLFIKSLSLKTVDEYITLMCKHNLDYLRLDPRPRPTGKVLRGDEGVRFISPKEEYVFSTVFSIFSKRLIEKLYENGCETAWDIERSRFEENYLLASYEKKHIEYENLVVKGKVDPIPLVQCDCSFSVFYSFRRRLFRGIISLIGINPFLQHVVLRGWRRLSG